MKSRKILYYSLAVVVLGTLAYFLFLRKKEKPVELITEKAATGAISETVTSTGTIQPVDTVAVGTQISGVIKEIYTDYNATVKKGQLLAILDPTLMQANVDQIRGNLAQAQANVTLQTANFERQRQLFEVGAISRAAYDNSLNAINAAKATVSSIQAQLRSAQQNLAFTKIYSPIDGVILSRSVSAGQTVAASFNTPTLFSIAKDITKMQVLAKVDEADIGNIKAKERVTFTVDAFLNDIFAGTVSEVRLRPSTSANVVTYTTIINANNDSLKLKPGMTATITIYTNEAEDALLVPVKATKFTPDSATLGEKFKIQPITKAKLAPDEAFVWVRSEDQILRKKIKTGLNDNSRVQVLAGLQPGEQVITGMKGEDGAVTTGTSASPFMPTRSRRR